MAEVKIHKVDTKWGNFTLHSPGKVERVYNGTTNDKGKIVGGLGREAADDDVLVEYDKMFGLIRGKEKAKVKSGCFWSTVDNQVVKEPKVIYVFRFGKVTTEVAADEPLPLQLRALQEAEHGAAIETEKIAEKDSVIKDLKKQVEDLAKLVKDSQKKEEPKKEDKK